MNIHTNLVKTVVDHSRIHAYSSKCVYEEASIVSELCGTLRGDLEDSLTYKVERTGPSTELDRITGVCLQ